MLRPAPAFRNYQVAAPLKPPAAHVSIRPLAAFRNYQVAAPLKQVVVVNTAPSITPFRNYQVAAPLKHSRNARKARQPERLPQLSSCGPIEAQVRAP